MANHTSIEYGILIDGCTYEDLAKVLTVNEDGDVTHRGKYVETPPFGKQLFVSYGHLDTTFPPSNGRAEAFQKRIGKVGKAKWGVIHTQR